MVQKTSWVLYTVCLQDHRECVVAYRGLYISDHYWINYLFNKDLLPKAASFLIDYLMEHNVRMYLLSIEMVLNINI